MTNKTVLFVMILMLAPFVYTQQKVVVLQTGKNDVRIDSSKPTVYISFERYDEPDYLWLRLYNNSRWTINFRTDSNFHGLVDKAPTWSVGRDEFGLLDGVEITPIYFIERFPIETSISNSSCAISWSWLSSGRSVVFKLPRKYLMKYDKLHIRFAYEWETEEFDEPKHQVIFDGRNKSLGSLNTQ